MRLLLRLLASLSAQGTVPAAAVLTQLEVLLSAAENEMRAATALARGSGRDRDGIAVSAQRCAFYLHSALAALPWWANAAAPASAAADSAAADAAAAGAGAGVSGAAAAVAASGPAALPARGSHERVALEWLASCGAGEDRLAADVAHLFARAEALLAEAAEAGCSVVPALAPAPLALSAARQSAGGAGGAQPWLDVPEDAPGSGAVGEAVLAQLRSAAAPDTLKLASALRAALGHEHHDDGNDGKAARRGRSRSDSRSGSDDEDDSGDDGSGARRSSGRGGSRAGAGSRSGMRQLHVHAWAVSSISRPQQDPAVAALLHEDSTGKPFSLDRLAGDSISGGFVVVRWDGRHKTFFAPVRPSSATAAASASPAAPSDAGGRSDERFSEAGDDALAAAAGGAGAGAGAGAGVGGAGGEAARELSPLAPPRNSFVSVAPASAFSVKPGVQLFGPGGGLSSTPAVMSALQLDHPALQGALALWCARDVAADVIVTYHPFHGETASVLTGLPMGSGSGRPHRNAIAAVANAPDGRAAEAAAAAVAAATAASPPPRSVVIALEALLGHCLVPAPGAPFPEPYIALVIMSILAEESTASRAWGERLPLLPSGDRVLPPPGLPGDGLATRTVGIAARVLWKNAWALDDAAMPRLACWIAHHAASTRWEWLWDEWAPALVGASHADADAGAGGGGAAGGAAGSAAAHAPADAQGRLLLHLLHRTFALLGPYHYDTVVAEKFPRSLAEAGVLPEVNVAAARSIFLPDFNTAPAPAMSALGVAGGGSSASAIDKAEGAAAAGRPSMGGNGSGSASGDAADAAASGDGDGGAIVDDAAEAARDAADEEAVDAFVRRCARDSPGLYRDINAGSMPSLRRAAAAMTAQLKAKLDDASMAAWLATGEGGAPSAACSAEDAAALRALSGPTRLLVFAHSLLCYAFANMRNTRTLIERYRTLLATLPLQLDGAAAAAAGGAGAGVGAGADVLDLQPLPAAGGSAPRTDDDSDASCARSSVLLDAVLAVWARQRHVAHATLCDMIDVGLLTCADVARHVLKTDILRLPSAQAAASASAAAPAAAAVAAAPAAYFSRTPTPGAAVAVPAAAVVSLLSERSLSLDSWQVVEESLAFARDVAHRDGVESFLFDGGKVYDTQEAEMEVAEGDAKSAQLRSHAAAAVRAYETAALGAVSAVVHAARCLQAHIDAAAAAAAGGAGGASAVALGPQQLRTAREALRVTLAHGRALFRVHRAALVRSAATRASLQALLAAGSTLGLEPDLAGVALAACTGSGPGPAQLIVPEALLRDADVPVPADVPADDLGRAADSADWPEATRD